jgi:hypothetical protein
MPIFGAQELSTAITLSAETKAIRAFICIFLWIFSLLCSSFSECVVCALLWVWRFSTAIFCCCLTYSSYTCCLKKASDPAEINKVNWKFTVPPAKVTHQSEILTSHFAMPGMRLLLMSSTTSASAAFLVFFGTATTAHHR